MKSLMMVCAILATATAIAAGQSDEEAVREAGGYVTRPGSSKGYVAIVNSQTRVKATEFEAALANLPNEIFYVFKFSNEESVKKNAQLVIKIVDDPEQPTLLAAPEEGWAQINVAKLAVAANAQLTVSRSRKELLRAFCYAAGVGSSSFTGNILDITAVPELDAADEYIPLDAHETIARHLAKRGLAPQERQLYELACEDGWAPEPKTPQQKVIWNRVHTLPSDPIVIRPEPKRK